MVVSTMVTTITGSMTNLAKVTTVSKEAMVTPRRAAAMEAQVMAGAAMAKGAATVAQDTVEVMAPVTAGAAMVGQAGAAAADSAVGK